MLVRQAFLPIAVACLGGCANLNSIYRPLDVAGSTGQAVAIDIKQRAIFSAPRKAELADGTKTQAVVICAEPSPDALSAYAASGGLAVARAPGTPVQGGLAAAEAAGSVGLRTQSIQLLRDGLFSNCISYMSGALKPNEFYQLQRRSQNFTLGLLAIEQLTGVVKADQIALSTAAATATGSDNTDKESASLDDAKKEQNEALKAYEKGKLDLAAARKAVADQEAKVASAQAAVSNPAKDATEAAKKSAQDTLDAEKVTLATKRQEAEVIKVDVDALARAATNADAKVAAAQSSLLMAQSRVRASAAGNASIAKAGGAAGIVTDHVSNAVVLIVNAVLAESGKGEQCNDALARLPFIPENQRAQAVLLACPAGEAEAAGAIVQATDPNAANAGTQIIQKAIQEAEVLRRAPVSSRPAPVPTSPPPAPAPKN